MSPINYSCSFVLQVFLITMLTVITWNQDSRKLHQCSREKSQLVRETILTKLVPIFEQQQVSIPKECPFHPERDYLWWPSSVGPMRIPIETAQSSDNQKGDQLWACPLCGEGFYCPERLIVHWDLEHRDGHTDRYNRDDLVCLADYCDIFRCDVLVRKRYNQQHNFMDYLSFGAEEVPKCEPDSMAVLERNCRNVVRQCTISLEANVSVQQFALVEKELIHSLCSFLTCDHYNDDLFTDESVSRKVPITLFSVLGVIMASGFCVCYYLIWTLFQRGLFSFSEKVNETYKTEDELKLSFNAKKLAHKSAQNIISNNHVIKNSFFQNIFEFSNEHKEDTFEFNDFNANTADYERKLRPISSIIEEDEDKDDSDSHDISYNSYPIMSRKYVKRKMNLDESRTVLGEQNANKSTFCADSVRSNQSIANDINKMPPPIRKQNQEIYLQDLPMKVHPKYIQPLKHSFSDRYPCYSGPSSELASALSKSRSYSHSQLRNAHNFNRMVFAAKPRRQDSIEEEWEQKSQNSHSSMSIKSSMSAPKIGDKNVDSNGKMRNTSKSSLSYNVVLPVKDDQPYHFAPSSKSNSNASIVSRTSMGSNSLTNRPTANHHYQPALIKR